MKWINTKTNLDFTLFLFYNILLKSRLFVKLRFQISNLHRIKVSFFRIWASAFSMCIKKNNLIQCYS